MASSTIRLRRPVEQPHPSDAATGLPPADTRSHPVESLGTEKAPCSTLVSLGAAGFVGDTSHPFNHLQVYSNVLRATLQPGLAGHSSPSASRGIVDEPP